LFNFNCLYAGVCRFVCVNATPYRGSCLAYLFILAYNYIIG